MKKGIWTTEELDFIREHINTMSNKDLATHLNRSFFSVKSCLSKNSIVRTDEYRRKIQATSYGTETSEELSFIKDNYLSMSIKEIARQLKRSHVFVRGCMTRHNIVIPRHLIEERQQNSRLKKGNVPHNKDKKMSAADIEKRKHTFYKKGHTPHNTLKDGQVTMRPSNPYLWIRIAPKKWKLYHKHIWEMHHGQVPDSYVINFRDQNTRNCTIENLYLVKRSENIRHNNKGGKKLPYELKESITIINKIKSKIKTYEK